MAEEGHLYAMELQGNCLSLCNSNRWKFRNVRKASLKPKWRKIGSKMLHVDIISLSISALI